MSISASPLKEKKPYEQNPSCRGQISAEVWKW